MSDEQDNPGSSSSGSGMTSRLASLRASIRASKAAKDNAETTEHETRETPEPTVSSPTAISSSQSLPVADDPSEPDDDLDDFVADDTQVSLSSDELPTPPDAEPEEAPRRPFRDSGENFITDDLHRVRPSSEDPLGEELHSGLLAQMDQMSEMDDDEDTSGFADPTIIQHIDDFAFVQGTPLYMSPEQCRDDPAGPGTDVYSLGVMMFELLEGFPPYVAETIEEVLFMHQDAPIPEQRSKFTPPEVRDLVTRMLAKDPRDRPGVAEVIEVLQRHAAIGGPDVHGLEEESWSVAEIEESEPIESPLQAVHPGGDHTVDSGLEEDDKLPVPLWAVGVLGVLLLFGTVVAVALAMDNSPADAPDEPVVVADEPEVDPTPDPEPDPEVVAEPDPTPEKPIEPMEFGAAELDAGTADAGTEADAGPSKEPEVQEPPKKKKRKRRKRRKRRRKPKKEELRELRLEL